MTAQANPNPLAQQVLIGEVALQARLAKRAADQLAEASSSIETWGAIQSLLVAAANVSKILWPPSKRHGGRAEQLRDLLGISERTLEPVRTFRNHFEHYDERVDRWFANNDSVGYMDLATGPRSASSSSFPRMFHRSYDPTTRTLSFREESIDLTAVVVALEEIRDKCRHLTPTAWD